MSLTRTGHRPDFCSPGFVGSREARITDLRKLLDRIRVAAGFVDAVTYADGTPMLDSKGQPELRGTLTSKMFRHTARLQTIDRGEPVSRYTVSREMGHGSQDMVDRVYSHLGTIRHRSEVVGYRIDQHAELLRDRLSVLGVATAGTTNGTAG